MEVIGRFAPSPSGRMHLGNVLCALLSYLSVRKQNGKYLLRIEDLDTARCSKENAAVLMDDLHWLGIEWDDTVQYQSERSKIYADYLQKLAEKKLLYPCFCSRAELNAASAPHLTDGRTIYAATCRNLTEKEQTEKRKHKKPAIRIQAPKEMIAFSDMVYGNYQEDLSEMCGDFILQRSDGIFAYQLAVVVDDALAGVNEVVRGSDLLSSTPRQIWLQKLLGFAAPQYIHIPLICADDGRRLSKREKDLDMGALRNRFSPEELLGILAAMAGLLDKDEEITMEELIAAFSWDKIGKENIYLPGRLK